MRGSRIYSNCKVHAAHLVVEISRSYKGSYNITEFDDYIRFANDYSRNFTGILEPEFHRHMLTANLTFATEVITLLELIF